MDGLISVYSPEYDAFVPSDDRIYENIEDLRQELYDLSFVLKNMIGEEEIMSEVVFQSMDEMVIVPQTWNVLTQQYDSDFINCTPVKDMFDVRKEVREHDRRLKEMINKADKFLKAHKAITGGTLSGVSTNIGGGKSIFGGNRKLKEDDELSFEEVLKKMNSK